MGTGSKWGFAGPRDMQDFILDGDSLSNYPIDDPYQTGRVHYLLSSMVASFLKHSVGVIPSPHDDGCIFNNLTLMMILLLMKQHSLILFNLK